MYIHIKRLKQIFSSIRIQLTMFSFQDALLNRINLYLRWR